MHRERIGRRTLANLPPVAKPTIIYDAELKGFGLRITPPSSLNAKGSRTWIVEYRLGSGGRGVSKSRVSLGSVDVLTPEKARDAAKTILANVRLGADPNAARAKERAAKTIRELEPIYSAGHVKRKPRTHLLFDGYWRNHILPSFGNVTAGKVTKSDVQRLHLALGATQPVTANRVLTLLSHFYAWAADRDLAPKGHNPTSGIQRYREVGRKGALSDDQLAQLGAALQIAETNGIECAPSNPSKRRLKIDSNAADAIRLLIFTGARLREILEREWSHYDRQAKVLRLPESKTGAKTIALPDLALAIFDRLWERAIHLEGTAASLDRPPSKFIFPAANLKSAKADLKRPWALVTRAAGLADVRLHDLRHTFATRGVEGNLGLAMIGTLLGHTRPETTARYAHAAMDPQRAAANHIAGIIAERLENRPD